MVEHFYMATRRLLPNTEFILTEGDKDRKSNIATTNSKIKGMMAFILGGIIIALAVNIFSSYIYDYISK